MMILVSTQQRNFQLWYEGSMIRLLVQPVQQNQTRLNNVHYNKTLVPAKKLFAY